VSSATQRARQREHRENTRREILAAAGRFLRERPYRELSVDVVMTDTGLTRTAFYRHFDDIPDLVLRLLGEVGGELVAIAEAWNRSVGAEPHRAAQQALGEVVAFFVRHGPLLQAIVDAAATDEQIERGYRAAFNGFVDITAHALDRLVAEGELRVPHTRALALALNLMNEAYLLHEFGREPFGDPEVALSTLETVWLRAAGVAAS
jgi:TetR/AcrR family transcriptional regulator, ethionamide resistance regulator